MEKQLPEGVRVIRAFLPKHPRTVVLYAHIEFDTAFGPMEVRNFRLFKANGKWQVGYPNAPIQPKEGETYKQVILKSERLKEVVCNAMVVAWEAQKTATEAVKEDKHFDSGFADYFSRLRPAGPVSKIAFQ